MPSEMVVSSCITVNVNPVVSVSTGYVVLNKNCVEYGTIMVKVTNTPAEQHNCYKISRSALTARLVLIIICKTI